MGAQPVHQEGRPAPGSWILDFVFVVVVRQILEKRHKSGSSRKKITDLSDLLSYLGGERAP